MLATKMARVVLYDHEGAPKGDLSPQEVLGLEMVEEVNGEHSLTITTTQDLEKNDRLLIQDGTLRWREFVVQGATAERADGGMVAREYWCVWSLQHDLSETYIDTQVGLVPGHHSIPNAARVGMEAALSGTTRWQVGTITVTSRASGSFYRRTGWEGMQTLVEKWGGELDAEITVGADGVTSRAVALLRQQGAGEATRRFDWGHDLKGIRRTVSDDPWTCRIVPLGKSSETEAGGYTRRPTIASVNSDVVWLEDADAVEATRVPDGNGGWEYPTQIVLNDTYEEPADLKAWALEHIKDYTEPKVTYECDVIQLEAAGLDQRGVALGDAVVIVDRGFVTAATPNGVRLHGRVAKVRTNLLDPTDCTVTIGTLSSGVGKALGGLSGRVSAVESQVLGMSQVQSTAEYLSDLLGRLNDEINATGGYTYITEGEGIRTYDVAVSDPLVGSEASAVVEVKGGTIRIANSRTSGGEWEWKTVFTSGHIAANLVTAAQITAGYIGSADSGNFWDLDSGEFRLAHVTGLDLSATNLVRNGNFIRGVAYWSAQGNMTRAAYEDSERGNVLRCVQTGEGGGTTARVYPPSSVFNHEVGKTYSVSFWAKASAAGTIYCSRGGGTGANASYVRGAEITTTWQRYSGTITAENSGLLSFFLGGTTGGTFYLSDVMLVESALPMLDWSVDPRDVQSQEEVFDTLTANGTLQGLYMSNGQLYINAEYIKAGYLSANRIQGGILKLGGSNNGNGQLEVYDADGTKTGTINNNGANLTGQITLSKDSAYVEGGDNYFRNRVTIGDVATLDSNKYWNLVGSNISGSESRIIAGLRIQGTKISNGSTMGRFMLIPRGEADGSSAYSGGWSSLSSLRRLVIVTSEGSEPCSWIMLNRGGSIRMGVGNGPTSSTSSTAGPVCITTTGMYVGDTSHTMNLTVNGTKNRQVSTEGFGDRLLYCYETPSPYFGDIGSGMTDETGECYVELDERLTEAMRTDLAYQTFLQPCGEGTLWVAEKAPGWFVVRGTPNLPFDWEVKARQTGYEAERLEDPELRDARDTAGETDLGVEALYEEEMGLIYKYEEIYEEETT